MFLVEIAVRGQPGSQPDQVFKLNEKEVEK